MNVAQFENIALVGGIGFLVLFMGFIIWDLGKQSNAGKFGYFVLFLALGLGVIGFLAKTIIAEFVLPH
jgi:hypothetical protein